MNQKDQELMKRYIYEVGCKVSKEQRHDITMELEELIGDMFEDQKGTMEEILIQLGDPKDFAKKYQNQGDYLIGPGYYENYIWILKIVLLCVGISSFLSEIIVYNYDSFNLKSYLNHILVNVSISLTETFGLVTIVFALLEYSQVKVQLKKEKSWSVESLQDNEKTAWNPSQLHPLPDKSAIIKRSSTIANVACLVCFGMLFTVKPEVFSAYVFEGKEFRHLIPLFNLSHWTSICPLLVLVFICGFIEQIIKLLAGCYCKLVLVANVVSNGIQLTLLTILIKFMPFWNPDFVTKLSEDYDYRAVSKGDILSYWGTDKFDNIILAIIFAFALLEVGTTLYRTLRYGNLKDMK